MLMIRGDLARFVLEDGSEVTLPDDFGLIHDPTGKVFDKCVLYLCKYKITSKKVSTIPESIAEHVEGYFDERARLVRASVEIPKGPWQRVGVVKTIFYTRYGIPEDLSEEPDGPFYHPFKGGAVLHESRCCHAYMLELVESCVVNAHGFVKP